MCDPKNAARNVNWNGYPMPNRGQDQTFADLAKDDPNIVVTIDDLEGGDQFANLPGGPRAVDQHLPGGEGLVTRRLAS